MAGRRADFTSGRLYEGRGHGRPFLGDSRLCSGFWRPKMDLLAGFSSCGTFQYFLISLVQTYCLIGLLGGRTLRLGPGCHRHRSQPWMVHLAWLDPKERAAHPRSGVITVLRSPYLSAFSFALRPRPFLLRLKPRVPETY